MRYLGAAIIFISSSLCGILAGQRERERLEECRGFLALFEYIRNQIGFFLMPTKEIYRKFENSALEKTGFLGELKRHEWDDVYFNVWCEAFAACEDRSLLSQKEKDIVLAFGSCIGKCDEHLQMKTFDACVDEMTEETRLLSVETEKNAKAYGVIGFTVGAVLSILIL